MVGKFCTDENTQHDQHYGWHANADRRLVCAMRAGRLHPGNRWRSHIAQGAGHFDDAVDRHCYHCWLAVVRFGT